MTEEKQQEQNKKFFWLKLKENFFRDKRIKKLRRIAGGDTYTIIYLKMQLLSLKENGLLLYEGVEDSLAEELATELDEETDNVIVTLNFLFKYGLLEEIDSERFLLPEAAKSIGKEGSSAERMRRHRAKKGREKLPSPSNSNELEAPKEDETSQCDDGVTKSDTEIEKEKEKEKEKEIEIELTDIQRERIEFFKPLFASWSVSDDDINYLIFLLSNNIPFDILDTPGSRDLKMYDEMQKLTLKAKADNVKHIKGWLEKVIPNTEF